MTSFERNKFAYVQKAYIIFNQSESDFMQHVRSQFFTFLFHPVLSKASQVYDDGERELVIS